MRWGRVWGERGALASGGAVWQPGQGLKKVAGPQAARACIGAWCVWRWLRVRGWSAGGDPWATPPVLPCLCLLLTAGLTDEGEQYTRQRTGEGIERWKAPCGPQEYVSRAPTVGGNQP